MYTKRFVCLANSRKTTGRCIAGKEVFPNGAFGPWIRPVSSRQTQELKDRERKLQRGGDPSLLDILEVGLKEPLPHAHQSEDHLIDERYQWIRRGFCSWNQLRVAVDVVESLWDTGNSSRYGLNDRISGPAAMHFQNSLVLINPQDFRVEVATEPTEFSERHRARAHFTFRRQEYRFSITDPIAEQHYFPKGNGEYPLENVLLCVSLGEPHTDGNCYKFCAGVLTPGWSIC